MSCCVSQTGYLWLPVATCGYLWLPVATCGLVQYLIQIICAPKTHYSCAQVSLQLCPSRFISSYYKVCSVGSIYLQSSLLSLGSSLFTSVPKYMVISVPKSGYLHAHICGYPYARNCCWQLVRQNIWLSLSMSVVYQCHGCGYVYVCLWFTVSLNMWQPLPQSRPVFTSETFIMMVALKRE